VELTIIFVEKYFNVITAKRAKSHNSFSLYNELVRELFISVFDSEIMGIKCESHENKIVTGVVITRKVSDFVTGSVIAKQVNDV